MGCEDVRSLVECPCAVCSHPKKGEPRISPTPILTANSRVGPNSPNSMRNVVRCYRHAEHLIPWPVLELSHSPSRLKPWHLCHKSLRAGPTIQYCGVKSRSMVKLKELPQGALGPPLKTDEEDDASPAYPTVLRQVRNNMRRFDNCVVLTRVGSFYEVGSVSVQYQLHHVNHASRCTLSTLLNTDLF